MKLIVCIALTALFLNMPVSADEHPGKELFLKNCKACHGADGKAQTPMGKRFKIKDYSQAEVQAGFTDERIFQVVKEGIVDENGKKLMLPFENKMSDEEISAVVAYVRSLKQ